MKNYYFVSFSFIQHNEWGHGHTHVSCENDFLITKCVETLEKDLKTKVIINNFRPVTEHYILINELMEGIIQL
jgi:hypothetical protein